MIKIEKTVYDKPEKADGKRILVMRIWPRGISKGRIDVWMKELGSPKELITRWKNNEITWDRFAREYRKSLIGKENLLKDLAAQSKRGTITLLCTEKDPGICHRSLLKDEVEKFAS